MTDMTCILALESLASEIEQFITDTVADAVPVKKYGGTLFTISPDVNESQFCGVFIYTKHVQISFSNGSQLSDVRGLLLGTGKFRRHINFKRLEDLDLKYIAELLKDAAGQTF